MTVYKGENHPGIRAYVGQAVTVQFRGRIAIFKTIADQHGLALTGVLEKVGGAMEIATTDVLERVTLLKVEDGFAYFEMKAPDKSVAEFGISVDLIATIWRPTTPPSSLLTV